MQIFEYPYVIITILAFAFLTACAVGLIFASKFIKTANGTVGKDFCSIRKLESLYEKLVKMQESRCVIYVGVSLDTISRLYSGSKALRILSGIRTALLNVFPGDYKGEIAVYGEKSFVAVVNCSGAQAMPDIMKCIEKAKKIISDNEAINVAYVRFGYMITRSTEVDFNTAVTRAKQAYIMAEHENSLCCEWNNTSGKNLEKKIKRENSISDEISGNRFFLEYQPIIDAKSGEPVGAEVLARLNSESDGVLSPGAFLSAVDSVGLNNKFDYYIFEKNCKWISNNKTQREKYVYTINFSRSTLCNRDFAQTITEMVDKYELNYSSIAVEILEDKTLTSEEREIMKENLSILKKKGVLILLDDFGSGYTSFMDLNSFGIDIVKIDKTITHNALSKNGFLILKNIVSTAKELKLKTLCEGVENAEHEKAAKDSGCDMLQGYYYYRPMPVAKLEEILGK